MLQAVNLSKYYQRGGETIRALDRVNLTLSEGEFLRIIGTSGSGKSTLLNLLAGLDSPTEGYVKVGQNRLSDLSDRQIAEYRARTVGMVFQSFNLIPYRTALQNVEMGMLFLDIPRRERRRRASEMLSELGLADRADHVPSNLSGGEQQRVAIARALAKEPRLLLADEPTGNLDEETSREIARLFGDLNAGGLTIVLVTHDSTLAFGGKGRTLRMTYGRFTSPESANPISPEGAAQ